MKSNILLVSAFVLVAASGCGDSNDTKKLLWPRSTIDTTSTKTKDYIVTASSKTGKLGPEGLFGAVKPGWHSASPPKFPESVTVDFRAPREVKFVDLLQQNDQPERAPSSLRIEISNDGKTWTEVGGSDNTCTPNNQDGWVNVDLAKPVTTQYLKLVINLNCGDPKILTLRGLRVD